MNDVDVVPYFQFLRHLPCYVSSEVYPSNKGHTQLLRMENVAQRAELQSPVLVEGWELFEIHLQFGFNILLKDLFCKTKEMSSS